MRSRMNAETSRWTTSSDYVKITEWKDIQSSEFDCDSLESQETKLKQIKRLYWDLDQMSQKMTSRTFAWDSWHDWDEELIN